MFRPWVAVGALGTGFLGVSAAALVCTVAPPAAPADSQVQALLVLATKPGAHEEAVRLAREGRTDLLIVSDPNPGSDYLGTLCLDPPEDVTVVCFVPSPSRTVGEVDAAVDIARSHGASSLGILTFREHAFRARLLAATRWDGDVVTFLFEPDRNVAETMHDVVYAMAAYPKMIVEDMTRPGPG